MIWGKDLSSTSYLQIAENWKPVLSIVCHSECGSLPSSVWSVQDCQAKKKNPQTTNSDEVKKVTRKVESGEISRELINSTLTQIPSELERFRYNEFSEDLSLASKYYNEARSRHRFLRLKVILKFWSLRYWGPRENVLFLISQTKVSCPKQ